MNLDPRDRQLALAFLQAVANATGSTPRTVGYLTLSNVQLLGLRMNDETLTKCERLEHMHAWVYVQCAPLSALGPALRAHSRWLMPAEGTAALTADEALARFNDEFVTPWLAGIDPEKMAEALDQFETLPELNAAMVDPGAPPREHGATKERPDPNA